MKLYSAGEQCVGTRRIPRAQHACVHPQAGHEGLLGLGSWNSKARLMGPHKDYLITQDWILTLRTDIYLRHFHQGENPSLHLQWDGQAQGMTQKWTSWAKGKQSPEGAFGNDFTHRVMCTRVGEMDPKTGVAFSCAVYTLTAPLCRNSFWNLQPPQPSNSFFLVPQLSPFVLEGRSNFPGLKFSSLIFLSSERATKRHQNHLGRYEWNLYSFLIISFLKYILLLLCQPLFHFSWYYSPFILRDQSPRICCIKKIL